MQNTMTLSAQPEDTGSRLDVFLFKHMPHYSRSFFKELICNGQVRINDKPVSKAGYILRAHDLIECTIPPVPPLSGLALPAEDMGIRIVYEHPDFLIVYKPAGIIVHRPHALSQTVTLVDWLVHHFKEISSVGSEDRPGIVHRLDKDTSGIMIVARNNQSHKILSDMFKTRTISKTYLALIVGHPDREGHIESTIMRHPVHKHKMAAHPNAGRHAITDYQIVSYYDEAALAIAFPLTGRTHQIRVHFASIGHPLLGDTTYGTGSPIINRHALHAYQLAFDYDGIYYNFLYDVPTDMHQAIEKLKKSKLT